MNSRKKEFFLLCKVLRQGVEYKEKGKVPSKCAGFPLVPDTASLSSAYILKEEGHRELLHHSQSKHYE
jgi:hypothetical protein